MGVEHYIIHDTAGNILRRGTCNTGKAKDKALPGEEVIVLTGDEIYEGSIDLTHEVKDKKVKRKAGVQP